MALPLCLVGFGCVAQECQVMLSRPALQLGNERYSASTQTLFMDQELAIRAECPGQSAISLRIDGFPDPSGQYFRFGERGKMTLSLISAIYDNAATDLIVMSPLNEEKPLSSGQPVLLLPGTRVTAVQANRTEKAGHQLTLQLRLTFPASGRDSRVRDLTEYAGQIRFVAQQ